MTIKTRGSYRRQTHRYRNCLSRKRTECHWAGRILSIRNTSLDVLPTLKLFFGSDPRIAGERANTFIYYMEDDPYSWVSPDCYVVFDISMDSIERYNTYRVWEVGKVPDFALEIGSPSTATNDLGKQARPVRPAGNW